MTKHNKLKASLTVETALVLPFVLFNLFGLLIIIVIMFQNTIQMTILNARALSSANSFSALFLEPGQTTVRGIRNDHGFLVDEYDNYASPDSLRRSAQSIYNLNNRVNVRNQLNVDAVILNRAQGSLDTEVLVFDREAFAVTTEYGNSVIIRARLTSFQNRLMGLDGDSFSLLQTAVAPFISPSQYIRQTDAMIAMLAVRTSVYYENYWEHPHQPLEIFLNEFYLDLFVGGTF